MRFIDFSKNLLSMKFIWNFVTNLSSWTMYKQPTNFHKEDTKTLSHPPANLRIHHQCHCSSTWASINQRTMTSQRSRFCAHNLLDNYSRVFPIVITADITSWLWPRATERQLENYSTRLNCDSPWKRCAAIQNAAPDIRHSAAHIFDQLFNSSLPSEVGSM